MPTSMGSLRSDAGKFRTTLICALVALAISLGGGGSPNPFAELLLQILTAAILATVLWLDRSRIGIRAPLSLWKCCGLIFMLPLLQLIPLPPSVWHALPGREIEHAALALVGAQQQWMPLSIAPNRTLASLLAMLPPLVLALLVAGEGSRARGLVLGTIAAMALVSAILGAAQISGPGDALRFYPDAHPGWLTGFHANRNGAADLLLIGSIALAACFSGQARNLHTAATVALLASLSLLGVALLFTGSRAGIALAPLAGLAILAMVFRLNFGNARQWIWLLAMMIGLAFVFASLAIFDQRLAFVASRFGMIDEVRLSLWDDSFAAVSASWPWGTGIGTFRQAFLPYESLDAVDATMPNRAHSDWLEFAMETGLLGYLILVAAAIPALRLARVSVADPSSRANAIFGLTTFNLIGLHALIDYPLRNMAVACLAGVALGMLVRPSAGWGRMEHSPDEGQWTEHEGARTNTNFSWREFRRNGRWLRSAARPCRPRRRGWLRVP